MFNLTLVIKDLYTVKYHTTHHEAFMWYRLREHYDPVKRHKCRVLLVVPPTPTS